MSDIIKTVQLQDPGSELVVLYDLEYSVGSFAHFFAGLDDDLTELQFRDSAGAVQTYAALPLEADGFDISSDGAYSRPEITVANIESVFKDAIGGLDFQDLIGKRLTRRTTLKKYLVGESNDSGAGNPPVEFPKIVYIIDRLKAKSIISATFELAAPFDLAGISLPRRVIIGGACPWKYKGLNPPAGTFPRGGCKWTSETLGGGIVPAGEAVYLNEFDEYILPNTITFSNIGSSVAKGDYHQTVENITRINSDGSTTSFSAPRYWQALRDQASSPVLPSDYDSFYWRSVRVYTTETSGLIAYTYKESRHNTYVLSSQGILWRAKKYAVVGTHSFIEGAYWTAGDKCGKTVTSCASRFQAKKHATITNGIAVDRLPTNLPFGGFPGAKQR